MCELGWRLADGRGEAPALLPALVEIVHAGSLIVDDIEDGSKLRRGAAACTSSTAFPARSTPGPGCTSGRLDLVDRLPLPRATRERIRDAVAAALHRGHLGQALDLSVSIGRMPRALIYRTVATSTMLKTGALMELAAVAGALAAGASDDTRSRRSPSSAAGWGSACRCSTISAISRADAPTASDTKALEDLRNDRPTWPWAHAAVDLDAAAFSQLQASARALWRMRRPRRHARRARWRRSCASPSE